MTNENHKGVSPPYNPPGKIGNLRRRIEKGVMSSCGGVITFHVDDCNSDKLKERMSLEKPAQCVTKRGRLSYERVHGGDRKR